MSSSTMTESSDGSRQRFMNKRGSLMSVQRIDILGYEMKIKVFTAFSGYDSQCMALDRLHEQFPDFEYELVGWAEIDKYAIQAHNAVYPQWADRNYGDISKINWDEVPDFDLFTYSSPCQDFSSAGLQRGGGRR